MSETKNIEFDANVCRVQTLVDQGLRVTLDLPETAITQAAWMCIIGWSDCKTIGIRIWRIKKDRQEIQTDGPRNPGH